MQAVWQHSKQSGGALVLLLAIADNAHDDGDGAFPSVGTLAKKARMSERNVNLVLLQLAQAGEIAITPGGGRGNTNSYRVLLPGLAKPETFTVKEDAKPVKVSVKHTGNPEVCDTETLKSATRNPEIPGKKTLRPTSPEPLVNHQENHPLEPSEQGPRAIRPTIETYQPGDDLIDGLASERPDLDLAAVTENWRDYHREKGTAIKDFNASLRRWVRNEKPAVRATHTSRGQPAAGFSSDDAFSRNMAKLRAVGRQT